MVTQQFVIDKRTGSLVSSHWSGAEPLKSAMSSRVLGARSKGGRGKKTWCGLENRSIGCDCFHVGVRRNRMVGLQECDTVYLLPREVGSQ